MSRRVVSLGRGKILAAALHGSIARWLRLIDHHIDAMVVLSLSRCG
jgi:predicted nucleotidyltransferase